MTSIIFYHPKLHGFQSVCILLSSKDVIFYHNDYVVSMYTRNEFKRMHVHWTFYLIYRRAGHLIVDVAEDKVI